MPSPGCGAGYGCRMTFSVQIVWSDDLLGYDFGPGHPMAPVRLGLTMDLARDLGVLDAPGISFVDPAPADDSLLARVHTHEFIDAVRAASYEGRSDPARGLGTDDVPIFAKMHDAAARIVGGSCAVAQAVWSGEATHGVNIAGGMHHAMPDAAAGFCVYNDASVAIQTLLDEGAQRVAYVDFDAHHGDGVERAFVDDPRVLTVSIHQSGATLFPGTGYPTDTGTGAGHGHAVNIALPPATVGSQWLRAIDAVVPDVLRAFGPEIIVSQHGCDAHAADPLSDLRVCVAAQRRAAMWIHDLAHELADGRWVVLGGGGYAVLDVVPFAWTHLLAIATHAPIALETPVPATWHARVTELYDRDAPETMAGAESQEAGDGFKPWSTGFDPESPWDRAIKATRLASFPLLGVHHEVF